MAINDFLSKTTLLVGALLLALPLAASAAKPCPARAWGSGRPADRWLFRDFFDSWWPLLKSKFLSVN